MSKHDTLTYTDFALPNNVVSKVDVARLVREAERIDNELTAQSVRKKAGARDSSAPVTSDQFTQFLEMNELSFKESKERTLLIKELRHMKDALPVIHMTFAVTADPESLQQIALWLRESVHKQAVIDVGLQPGLVAGVYLRTANHVQDLSLKGKLQGQRGLLVKELEALRGK